MEQPYTIGRTRPPYAYPKSTYPQQRQVPPTIQEEYTFDKGDTVGYAGSREATPDPDKGHSSLSTQAYPSRASDPAQSGYTQGSMPPQDPYKYPKQGYARGFSPAEQTGYYEPSEQHGYTPQGQDPEGYYPAEEKQQLPPDSGRAQAPPERVYRAPAHRKRTPTRPAPSTSYPSRQEPRRAGPSTTPPVPTQTQVVHAQAYTAPEQIQATVSEAQVHEAEPVMEPQVVGTEEEVPREYKRKKKRKKKRRPVESGEYVVGETNPAYDPVTGAQAEGACQGDSGQAAPSSGQQRYYAPPQPTQHYRRQYRGHPEHEESQA